MKAEVVELIREAYDHDKKKVIAACVAEANIFDNHWLDVEPIFEDCGWKVEYDKPGFNENYPATFKFTPKREKNS